VVALPLPSAKQHDHGLICAHGQIEDGHERTREFLWVSLKVVIIEPLSFVIEYKTWYSLLREVGMNVTFAKNELKSPTSFPLFKD
jgi:hypothetical protein